MLHTFSLTHTHTRTHTGSHAVFIGSGAERRRPWWRSKGCCTVVKRTLLTRLSLLLALIKKKKHDSKDWNACACVYGCEMCVGYFCTFWYNAALLIPASAGFEFTYDLTLTAFTVEHTVCRANRYCRPDLYPFLDISFQESILLRKISSSQCRKMMLSCYQNITTNYSYNNCLLLFC